jgi:predicted enzyme involved in methoxymalonyl-ACP biosynthesis
MALFLFFIFHSLIFHYPSILLNNLPRTLAAELQLGLDSLIVVSSSASDCAAVRSECPGAFVLQLPTDPERIAAVLEHCWAFDPLPSVPAEVPAE